MSDISEIEKIPHLSYADHKPFPAYRIDDVTNALNEKLITPAEAYKYAKEIFTWHEKEEN